VWSMLLFLSAAVQRATRRVQAHLTMRFVKVYDEVNFDASHRPLQFWRS
jgi:hypothetical protein